MDNITLLGVIGSIVSIISLFISLLASSTNNNFLSRNKNSFNQTLNVNSNNTTTNNFDFRTAYMPNPTPKSSNTSQDPFAMVIIGIAAMGIVIPLYLKYQDIVIFYVIIFGIIGLLINSLIIFYLNKRFLLNKLYLCTSTLRWFPLFILLIFIYHPLYTSDTLINTKQLLMSGVGFLTTIHSNYFDVFFFAMQLIGLGLIALLIAINIYKSLKQLYSAIKKHQPPTAVTFKDCVWYTLSIMFLFILISGLYVRFFNYLDTVMK